MQPHSWLFTLRRPDWMGAADPLRRGQACPEFVLTLRVLLLVLLAGLGLSARAATLTVNTLDDLNVPDNKLSLREAVLLINADGDAVAALGGILSSGEAAQVNQTQPYGTNDTIQFDNALAGGTITLNGTQLELKRSVLINGLGPDQLSISGDDRSRVFSLTETEPMTCTIRNLKITRGRADDGAAIHVLTIFTAILNLENVVVQNNNSVSPGPAVLIAFATLNAVKCAFVNNPGNSEVLKLQDSNATISDSTIAANPADLGAILFQSIQGGFNNTSNCTLTLKNVTMAGNGGTGVRIGAVPGQTATVNCSNSIFAEQTGSNFNRLNNGGTETVTSGGNNILDDASITTVSTDLTGTDPRLGPLEINRGTYVRPLLRGSLAIDRFAAAGASATDQRGLPRSDGNGNGGIGGDCGAYEYQALVRLVEPGDAVQHFTVLYDSGSDQVRVVDTDFPGSIVLLADKDDLDVVWINADQPNSINENTLTIDASLLPLSLDVAFNGGIPFFGDQLVLPAATATTVNHAFTNDGAGSIDIDLLHIDYYRAEALLTDRIIAASRGFVFNGGAQTITISDSGGSDARSRIDSTLSPVVEFRNPSQTMTVHGGPSDDVINFSGIDPGFNATLIMDGRAGTDAITLVGSFKPFGGPGALSASADTVTVSPGAEIFIDATSDGRVYLRSQGDLRIGASIQTAGTVLLTAGWDGLTGADDPFFGGYADAAEYGNGMAAVHFEAGPALQINCSPSTLLVLGSRLTQGGSNTTLGGPLATGAIVFIVDSIALQGPVQSSGALSIQNRTLTAVTGIGTGTGTLQLDAAELALLSDGFSSIAINPVQLSGDLNMVDTVLRDWTIIGGNRISLQNVNAGANTLLLGARHSITATGPAPAITADWISLNSITPEMVVGSAAAPLTLDVNRIIANCQNEQYLSEANTAVLNGIQTGPAGTVHLVDGTFVAEDFYAVEGHVAVGSGAVLAGAGGIRGVVTVENGGILAPGASPGILTVEGDVRFRPGSIFQVEINGVNSPGVDYDQLKVQGPVIIEAGATLAASGTLATAPTAAGIRLIDNDGAEPVYYSTFTGLAQGAPITVNGQPLFASYRGGDGNDFVLGSTEIIYNSVTAWSLYQ